MNRAVRSSSGAGVTLASLATMGGELGSDRMSPVVGTAADMTRRQPWWRFVRRADTAVPSIAPSSYLGRLRSAEHSVDGSSPMVSRGRTVRVAAPCGTGAVRELPDSPSGWRWAP